MTRTAHTPGPLLVVDDDRLVLLTLVHGLREAGYTVLEADNGDDAILLAREHQPALAVLDIRMQGLSGFDVAQYLRDYTRTPFLFLSAFADEAVREQAQALGAVACLSKPTTLHELLPVVQAALGKATAEAAGAASGVASNAVNSAPVRDGHGPAEGPQVPLGTGAVDMATGILMHRLSLTPPAARVQLQKWAHERGQSLEQAAEALVEAQTTLAQASGRSP